MEYREYTGKTVEDAVMEAAIQLETSSDKLEYEVLDKGSSGFLGIGSRPAKIRACKVLDRKGRVEEFLKQVFGAMEHLGTGNECNNQTGRLPMDLSDTPFGVSVQ